MQMNRINSAGSETLYRQESYMQMNRINSADSGTLYRQESYMQMNKFPLDQFITKCTEAVQCPQLVKTAGQDWVQLGHSQG